MQSCDGYHTDTGLSPIDNMAFRQKPAVEAFHHATSDIIMFRANGHGTAGTVTSVSRGADERDILLWARGTGTDVFGKMAGTPFKAPRSFANRIAFTPLGADAELTFIASAHSSNLLFAPGYLARLIHEQNPREFAPHLLQEDENLLRLARMLADEIAEPGFASHLVVEGISHAIAALLARVDASKAADEADRIYLAPWKLKRLVDYIEDHLDHAITLNDLAHVADLSTFHFSRVFKQAMGTSPYQYVRDQRLERGRYLLATTDMGIVELALACGFSNQSHFTAAFSKAMGISPARFRQVARR